MCSTSSPMSDCRRHWKHPPAWWWRILRGSKNETSVAAEYQSPAVALRHSGGASTNGGGLDQPRSQRLGRSQHFLPELLQSRQRHGCRKRAGCCCLAAPFLPPHGTVYTAIGTGNQRRRLRCGRKFCAVVGPAVGEPPLGFGGRRFPVPHSDGGKSHPQSLAAGDFSARRQGD